MDEILKDFRVTVRYALWYYCGGTHETFAFEAWKRIIARPEKACEAKGKEVGRVTRTGEYIAGYLKLLTAYGDKNIGVEKLGYEAMKAVELCIGVKPDVVSVIFRHDIVSCNRVR